MKITMLTGVSGPGLCASPGETVELADIEARRFVAAGFAEPVEPETASAPAAEAPARKQPEKRKR